MLDRVREHSGLSLTQLAEAVELPKSTVLRPAAPRSRRKLGRPSR
ncbi:helix-turn-helix domain-containing protein [Nonomuraea turkmeniaca]|nr:helix-turn-helix domain-containing protein [Nonomuraea turkmeniaca]